MGEGRFEVEDVDERLRPGASEAEEVVQLVGYCVANKDSASMNRGGGLECALIVDVEQTG